MMGKKAPRTPKDVIPAFVGMTVLFFSSLLHARPLITEEVATVGKATFEAGFSPSYRSDAFNEPRNTYETVALPVDFSIGLHPRLDIGFQLASITQRLERQDVVFRGSRTGLFSPALKFSPTSYIGGKIIWHAKLSETDQELPIARGDDVEALLLLQAPSSWPLYFNLGYLFKDSYDSKFGVVNGTLYKMKPGNILEAKAAVEIPLVWNTAFLLETAYYNVAQKKIGEQTIPNSSGNVWDVVTGLGWAYKGWHINWGLGFGLLKEELTSFDLERGAGDLWSGFHFSYRLNPKRPNRY